MCDSRKINKKINKIHERALRAIFQDYVSSFAVLLETDESFIIHDWNLQCLAIEIHCIVNDIFPSLISDIFKIKVLRYNKW